MHTKQSKMYKLCYKIKFTAHKTQSSPNNIFAELQTVLINEYYSHYHSAKIDSSIHSHSYNKWNTHNTETGNEWIFLSHFYIFVNIILYIFFYFYISVVWMETHKNNFYYFFFLMCCFNSFVSFVLFSWCFIQNLFLLFRTFVIPFIAV